MSRYDDQVNWYQLLVETAAHMQTGEPMTLHVGTNAHEALIAAGAPPEELTLVMPSGMTEPGQEWDMVNAAGQNNVRPRVVDRKKVKAGRRAARANRKHGRK